MFVSFYSYKGGVGRTQLLVNIAHYLCYYKDFKILMLEWDMEAPGLHYYFKKEDRNITDADIKQEGLLEVLTKYMDLASKKHSIEVEDLPFFTKDNIVERLTESKSGKGHIDLIPCIKYDQDNFTQKINDFDWKEFTELRDGNVFIDFLKKKIQDNFDYDFVFIDSRTGIADYSGICNILLPDVNVIAVAPTHQNFEGALKITKAIAEHPYLKEGQRKPFILPILSRIDENIPQEKYTYWVERFENDFAFVTEVLLPENLKKFEKEVFRDLYLKNTILHYNLNLAVGENNLFNQNKKQNQRLPIAQNYENIAKYIDRLRQEAYLDYYSELNTETLEDWLDDSDYLDKWIDIIDIYREIGNLQKAKELANSSLDIAKNLEDKYTLGKFYDRLGLIEENLGNLEQASAYFKKMQEIFEILNQENNKNNKTYLALSYERLGDIEISLGNMEQALANFKVYNQLQQELYKDYPDYTQAKDNLAISYQFLGNTQVSLGNLEKALSYFEEYNKLEKELYQAYPNNVRFKNGLAISYQFLGHTQVSLGNLEKALEFFEEYNKLEKELYKAYPNNVNFKHGLASSYLKLGETREKLDYISKAKNYYLESQKLYQELVKTSPNYAKFQYNFRWVEDKLAELE